MTSPYTLPLLTLALLFAGSMLGVGRGPGLRCLAMLAWVPLLLFGTGWLVTAGKLPLLPVVLAAGLLATVGQTLLLLGGGAPARRAVVGACGGYAVAVAVGLVGLYVFRLTGIYSAVTRDLWYAPGTGHLPFHWLVLGGIAIAGAGLIADLAVAVTATIVEVRATAPGASRSSLFAAGMRFGRDVIGTEVNTLPLAIFGVAMGGLLLLLVRPDVAQWPYSWLILSNRQETAVEILALAAGTIALVLTIPLTAFSVARGAARHPVPAGGTGARAPARLWPYVLVLPLLAVAGAAAYGLGRTSYRYPADAGRTTTTLVRGVARTVRPAVSPWAPRGSAPGGEYLQTLEVTLPHRGAVAVENPLTGSPVNDRVPLAGDRVLVRLQEGADGAYAALSDLERDRGLLLLLALTGVVVVLVAGWRGWGAIASLVACVVALALLLVALVRWRLPPLPTTLVWTLLATTLLFLVLCGWTRKAFCAAAGTVAGLAAAGLAAWLFGSWLALSGRHDSDLLTLSLYSAGRALDFPGLLTSAVLIGALGVTTDVAMAIVSAVGEVHRADPRLGFRALLAAGLAVGRQVLAAMFGALLFAYVGLNLGVFLLPWAGTGSLGQAFGNEKVITEVFRLLVGGLALVWAVPATSLVSAWAESRRKDL